MEMTNFEMYNKLRPKLGDEAAQEMITFVNAIIKTEMMDLTKIFMTKDDKVDLTGQIKGDKVELIRLIKDQKSELMHQMISDKADIMKAVYMTGTFNFLAIACTVIGVMIAVLNFISKN